MRRKELCALSAHQDQNGTCAVGWEWAVPVITFHLNSACTHFSVCSSNIFCRVIKSVSWPGTERVNEQLCPQFISFLLFIFLHGTESGWVERSEWGKEWGKVTERGTVSIAVITNVLMWTKKSNKVAMKTSDFIRDLRLTDCNRTPHLLMLAWEEWCEVSMWTLVILSYTPSCLRPTFVQQERWRH